MGHSVNTRLLLEYEDSMLIKKEERNARPPPQPSKTSWNCPFLPFQILRRKQYSFHCIIHIFRTLAQDICLECVWDLPVSSILCYKGHPLAGLERWLLVKHLPLKHKGLCSNPCHPLKPGVVAQAYSSRDDVVGGGKRKISGSLWLN